MRRTPRPVLGLAIVTTVLGLVLAACGTTQDTSAPSLTITSQTSATSATYHLKGTTSDNVGATKITYAVDGGPTQTVDLTGTAFDVTITLKVGANTIDVKAYDAAGNVKEVLFHVTFTPPGATTGSLKVTVQNLPSGANADVDVSGPGSYGHHLTASATLTGLPPGTYTITPHAVTVNLVYFEGAATPVSVDVTAGATATSTVDYTAYYGFLDVTVRGLPSGLNADATVTGPGSYQQAVTSTTTLSALVPGSYTVAAKSVTDASTKDAYAPAVTGSPATIVAKQHTSATVAYTRTTNHLDVSVSGLPSGVSAAITVTGPSAYSQTLTGGATLTGLADGSYLVKAADVSYGGDTYVPVLASQTVALAGGQDASAIVTYAVQAASTGSLTVTFQGQPSGVDGSAVVLNSSGFRQTITGSGTLGNLAPGTYHIAPLAVNDATYSYTGTASPADVTVNAGATATTTVTYAVNSGAVTVTVQGLDASTFGDITLTGPSGTLYVGQTVTYPYLDPGNYVVTVQDVSTQLYSFHGTASAGTVTVSAGNTATLNVGYVATEGALTVTIPTSYPIVPDVTVTGPGTSQTLNGYAQLAHLTPGTYTVSANDVTDGIYNYRGTVSAPTVSVQAGATASDSVDYQPIDGALHAIVNGLPTGTPADIVLYPLDPGLTGFTIDYSNYFTRVPAGHYRWLITEVKGSDQELYFDAADASAPVTIQAGVMTTQTFTFAQVSGDLQLDLAGTITGTVTVTSADSSHPSSQSVSASTLLKGLWASSASAGTSYTLTANTVHDSSYDYSAAPSSVNVQRTQQASATVTFAPVDGAMAVHWQGTLPSGASYGATITDAKGNSKHVSAPASATYASGAPYLAPGTATVTPDAIPLTCVAHQLTSYPATVTPTSTPTITKGSTTSITISYTASPGGPC